MGKDLGRIEQSPADDRTYRALELENGLQVNMTTYQSLGGRG